MATRAPVYFLIFNRPHTTARVFEAVAAARPCKLFVFADGPRQNEPNDRSACLAARAVVERVDWPCEVHRNYSETNLGCGKGIPAGLNWVFDHVEEAVVLEDDCVPHPSFFEYCDEVLERYRGDTRIIHIGGNNFQGDISRGPYSYYFSKYSHTWGWATWRRAWALFDSGIMRWAEMRASAEFRSLYQSEEEWQHWASIFDRLQAGGLETTWDYAWAFNCWVNGLAVTPNVNLVSNIGFGSGTHTLSPSPLGNMSTRDIGNIEHPPDIVRDLDADSHTFASVVSARAPIFQPHMPWQSRIRARLAGLKRSVLRMVAGP